MNNPALKGEVSLNKMLRQIKPRLRRFNIVSNSFSSCISNASEEFSWTPEMSFSKMVSQPRMLFKNHKSTISFEQLQGFADAHCNWHFNKQVDMVNSNVQLINFEAMPISNLPDKELAIHSNPIELHRVFSVFTFPDKMESVLSEGMFGRFQIHFFAPKSDRTNIAHANFLFNSGAQQSLSNIQNSKELNLVEEGNSSLCLKAEVSLPLM
jgi:hypothetical protein